MIADGLFYFKTHQLDRRRGSFSYAEQVQQCRAEVNPVIWSALLLYILDNPFIGVSKMILYLVAKELDVHVRNFRELRGLMVRIEALSLHEGK